MVELAGIKLWVRKAEVSGMSDVLRKGNPLRSELNWQVILVEGLIAVGIGLYAVLAQANAHRNIIFLTGVFLLINGLSHAFGGLRRSSADPMARYRLLRAGIGIATGLIVVIDRFADLMSVNSARIVLAIGLLGIGLVTLIGLVTVRGEVERRMVGLVIAVLFIVWGAVVLYLVSIDSSSAGPLGWAAIVVGVLLVLLALYRRQQATARLASS